jgi:L-asparaginase
MSGPSTVGGGAVPRAEVVVLATGGTIAGAGRHGTSSQYSSAALRVDELLASIPELDALARVSGEQVAQIPSQEVDDALWLRLGRRVNARLLEEGVRGVVVTHGTDTIEETAWFLNLVSTSDKPVVLTGAMRPATALSADGPLNLYNSVAVAADASAIGRGVLVVMNDEIHGARDVTKTHTTFVQTFDSPDRGPLGAIHYGRARFFRRPTRERGQEVPFPLEAALHLPRVDVLYAHSSFRADLVEAALGLGAQGIVVAGVGNGNLSRAAIASLAEASRRGVVVVRSSRAGSGAVLRNVEIDDDAHSFVASDGLNPQKARVLLQLALTRTRDPREIQELFYTW